MPASAVLGKSINRVEGPSKITGKAVYTGDRHLANCVFGVLVGSAVGKGKIISMNEAAATAAPGVLAGLSFIDATAKAKAGDEREKYSFESFGAVFVEVEVRETPPIQVTRVTAAYDVGSILNPKLAKIS